MNYKIREMKREDWNRVRAIYLQGIATKKATFQTEAPEYEAWDQGHLKECRFVAVDEEDRVMGWIALSPTSSRYVYRGVVEVSIYVAEEARGNQIGYLLMMKTIEETEKLDIWTLYSVILEVNEVSLALHKKCGFREIGTRERIAQDADGIWRDTVVMERRSKIAGK
ncbi:GNAT family N-acetyltransferase [Cellulosilyticum ruminicola]|uniref:GNAT family N-acetyltransferase n=1 Tax=Cellulosilyticum ruminicola TaxID=425254 RepID=UPI0006D1A36A|nr:GNAT family N-acetyltransferase [Cellulosilyticum ruminicola]